MTKLLFVMDKAIHKARYGRWLKKRGSLEDHYPELLKYWDYEANGNLTPDTVIAGSKIKARWACDKGHKYPIRIHCKAHRGQNCPYCSGKKPWPGENDLATLHPECLPYWDYEANGDLAPDKVFPTSAARAHWICSKGHKYQMTIYHKITKDPECPECRRLRLRPEPDDLATVRPDIAKDWDYTKNGMLTPDDVPVSRYRKAYWVCRECNYRYKMTVRKRAQGGFGCPRCLSAKRRRKQEAPIREVIVRWHNRMPYLGCKKIKVKLAEEGMIVSSRRANRIMREMGFQTAHLKPAAYTKKKLKKKVLPYLLQDMDISKPNQVWSVDISYVKHGSAFMYLIAIIDWHSRYLVGWTLSGEQKVKSVLETVQKAIKWHGTPEIINSDQGVQFRSRCYREFLESHGIRQSMNGRVPFVDNRRIERWFRSFKCEYFYANEFDTAEALRLGIAKYVEDYNHQRPHESLGHAVPAAVYGAA